MTATFTGLGATDLSWWPSGPPMRPCGFDPETRPHAAGRNLSTVMHWNGTPMACTGPIAGVLARLVHRHYEEEDARCS